MTGTTAGSDELVLYVFGGSSGTYYHQFAIIDREGNCIESFETKQDLLENAPIRIIRDGKGNIHFWNGHEGYFILNNKGELIFEEKSTNSRDVSFSGTTDGQVLLNERETNKCLKLFKVNADEKELILDFETMSEDKNKNALYATCTSDGTVYYVMNDGVYRYQSGEEPEQIYLFRNHGISLWEVDGMEVNEKGEIGIVYNDSKGITYYLLLEPTVEQIDIIEIPFVISETNSRQYAEAIVNFNKKYPQYVLDIVTYEDEKQLQTELIAGKEPVLIDTQEIGFEENVELWECLEGVFHEELSQNVLEERVLDSCRVDGKLYGLVTYWTMLSYATMNKDISTWTTDELVNCLLETPSLKGLYSEQSPTQFLELFIFQGMEGSSYWNVRNDEVYLDTFEFQQLLGLSKELAVKKDINSIEWLHGVRNGEYFGELVYINGAESLAYYNKILGEEIEYSGFPSKEKAVHYICSGAPITIRSTATEEQKLGAGLFLKYLVSAEIQEEISQTSTLSVRTDILKQYLQNIPEKEIWNMEGEAFEIDIDKEKIRGQFTEIYENAVPMPELPIEVKNMIKEELEPFFSGQKTAEQVGGILQNRMQLYLHEHDVLNGSIR